MNGESSRYGWLDSLVLRIIKSRPNFKCPDFSQVSPCGETDGNIRGIVAEAYVKRWLQQCPDVDIYDGFPQSRQGLKFTRISSGVLVQDEKRLADKHPETDVHEFDNMVLYEGHPVIIHVKSTRLNGISKPEKIQDGRDKGYIPYFQTALQCARALHKTHNVGILLFYPFYMNRGLRNYPDRVRQDFPQVRCVNLKYQRDDLSRAVTRFKKHRALA